ncbi:L2HGDH [Bugula neritina]|uniref:L-2-hydroxyglutarate dehydrogenase, mitochondrial n=1 Tax=Bugula neritina TaxID=10212 RepID=A0A7J7KDY2_BUGNE|nr:L2HGDH [Bugula neritina]
MWKVTGPSAAGKKLVGVGVFRSFSCSSNGNSDKHCYDVAVVGGGIVGPAVVREVQTRYPTLKCAILEKESSFAQHQSGRSSGVIHAGIYYKPDSLMAKLCVSGLHKMYKFCERHKIPHERCGKLIVATEREELPRLDELLSRAKVNNVPDVKMIEGNEIQDIEPHCQGLRAIHSPHTGIVDYGAVANHLVELFRRDGGQTYTNFEVSSFSKPEATSSEYVCIHSKNKETVIKSKYVITCAGLYSDKVAQMSGGDRLPKIVPFRGDYLVLKPGKRHLARGNIYPVPDPRFPFLGFHFTPRMNGDMWLGPNAVLAFKREGYSPFDFNAKEFIEAITYRGVQKLVLKNFGYAASELYYGVNLRATVKKLQRFIPDITPDDVERGPSGVRAIALAPDGTLVSDFIYEGGTGDFSPHMLHVRNAPSPAATSSLAIAEMVVDEAQKRFHL